VSLCAVSYGYLCRCVQFLMDICVAVCSFLWMRVTRSRALKQTTNSSSASILGPAPYSQCPGMCPLKTYCSTASKTPPPSYVLAQGFTIPIYCWFILNRPLLSCFLAQAFTIPIYYWFIRSSTPPSHILAQAFAITICCWLTPRNPDLQKIRTLCPDLGTRRKYDYSQLLHLLRALRNKKSHYYDLPPNVRLLLGDMPLGYLA
jgi:hypothetical protein